MHILALLVTLALAYPTRAVSKTGHSRVLYKSEEAPHLSFNLYPTTKQLHENMNDISLLSRRNSPPPSPSGSSSPENLPPALPDPGKDRRVSTRTRRLIDPYVEGRGNHYTSIRSSHGVHDAGTSKTWRSSVKVKNPSMEANGNAVAKGRSVKFKVDTRTGTNVHTNRHKRAGRMYIHGPGRYHVWTERPHGPDLKMVPKGEWGDIEEGKNHPVTIYRESKVEGRIDAENPRTKSHQPAPHVDAKLYGTGKMKMTAKHP